MESAAEVLRRWETAGGHWRVLSRSGTDVVVGLFSCDGGEEMERLSLPSTALDGLSEGPRGRDD